MKQYESEGKTIVASTLGQETEHNCIVFFDAEGVYFDNIKNVSRLITFGKSYTCVSSELSIPCGKSGLEIKNRSWEYVFSQEKIDDFEIYPIGDWATIILGKNKPGADIPSFIMRNGSDSIFIVNTFDSWHSKYRLKYDYVSDAVEYEGEDEYGNATTGVFASVSMNKETGNDEEPENIAIKLSGGYGRLQSDCDNISHYFARCEQEFFDWLDDNYGCSSYSAKLYIKPEHFFDVSSISSITFDELENEEFQSTDIGTKAMYEEIAVAIYAKYLTEMEEIAKREKNAQIQRILNQCTSLVQLQNDMGNEIYAERIYAGKTIYLNLDLSSIKRVDSRYTDNQYMIESQYVDLSTNIDVYLYTDDESFTNIQYPHKCVVSGKLMIRRSSVDRISLEDCELILY